MKIINVPQSKKIDKKAESVKIVLHISPLLNNRLEKYVDRTGVKNTVATITALSDFLTANDL